MKYQYILSAGLSAALMCPNAAAAQDSMASQPSVSFVQAISCAANNSALTHYAHREEGEEATPLAAAINAEDWQIDEWRESVFAWGVMGDALNLHPAVNVRSLITTATFDIQKEILLLEDEPERAAGYLVAFGQDCEFWASQNSDAFGAIPAAPDYPQDGLTMEQAVTCTAYVSLMAAAVGASNTEEAAKGEEHQQRWLYLAAMRDGGDFDAVTLKVTPEIERMGKILEGYEIEGNDFASSLFIFGNRNACRTLRMANADEWEAVDLTIYY